MLDEAQFNSRNPKFAGRLGILSSHPIQYYSPWFRALAKQTDLEVFYAHRPNQAQQGAGFGKSFDWDVDLFSGYSHWFLKNISHRPGVSHFSGCDTPEIRDLIRAGKFDAFIVIGWYLKTFWQAIWACRRAGVPVLVRGDSQLLTPRSPIKSLAKSATYRLLLRQFDGFLAVGQRNREYLEHYGVPAKKIFLVPHFVDNEWFAVRAEEDRKRRPEIRSQWGANDETLVALFVGKFIEMKRPVDLLLALARLREQGVAAIGVFVGAGELEAELQAVAERLGVTAKFVGFKNQTELPAYYVSADVLILPSESETWGLVVNEAMACGLPAIVSDAVGCAPDLIDEGKTGFTFALGNPGQLAQQLNRFGGISQNKKDFAPALAYKLKAYSIEAAVAGTLTALKTVHSRRISS